MIEKQLSDGREMLSFATSVRTWMSADPSNVIAIHCKGGKGRTGTMISVWLLECGIFDEAEVMWLSYIDSVCTPVMLCCRGNG